MANLYIPNGTANIMIDDSTNGILTSGSSTSASIISGSGTSSVSLLLIYKGTAATFPALTDRSTRASDLLITFTIPTSSQYQNLGYSGTNLQYVIGKCQTVTTASASGTAAWFILCRSGTTSMTDKGAMIGTVGTLGSGADLEIANVDIVSGQSYQSTGMLISLPQGWDV
jgi:hypothetical protein